MAIPACHTKVGARSVFFAGLLGVAIAGAAQATTVYVTSVGYSAAQLVINGTTVRSVQIGETTPEGVRLDNIEGGVAILEVDRRLVRLGMGQSVSPDITIQMGGDGTFRLTVYANGVPLRAIVDTGASNVAISSATARQLGIDYLRGQRGVAHTANGSVASYLVNIPRIQVGEIVVSNVAGIVSEGVTISKDTDVLLGNSFLKHVDLRRSGNSMVIRRANAF
jgi:aspartyl protease family protein